VIGGWRGDRFSNLRIPARIHQRFTDTLFELSTTGDNVDVKGIESAAFDFNPGMLVVIGTPHLGNSGDIFPSNLFDRRIEL
jgi:hypothetical protein